MTRLTPRLWMCMSSIPDVVSGLGFIEESEEDEWVALGNRFEREGLNFGLPLEEKLLHVWRWLGDAEYNLHTSRKMLDKQRTQQAQEIKEVELFVSKLKDITDERVSKVEMEKEQLEKEIELLQSQGNTSNSNEIAAMLKQEGLHHILHCSLSEKVAYLLVERARLMEEIVSEIEKHKGLTANLTDNVKLSYPQVHEIMEKQKTEFEEKLRQQKESAAHIREEMKKTHEEEIRHIRQDLQDSRKTVEVLCSGNPAAVKDSLQLKCKDLDVKVMELSERNKKMEKAMRQLENENETLIYKLSEALTECDEKEAELRSVKMKFATSLRRSSKNELLHRSESSLKHNADKIAVKDEVIKKLQFEIEKSHEQLLKAGQKYEDLAMKSERRKNREKAHLLKEREKHNREINILKQKVRELQEEVSVAQVTLNTERNYRDKVLTNMAQLTEENKRLSNRLLETEEVVKEKARTLSLLNVRVSYLEKEKTTWTEKRTLSDSSVLESTQSLVRIASSTNTDEQIKDAQATASNDTAPDLHLPAGEMRMINKTETIDGRPLLLRWFSQPEAANPVEEHQVLARSKLTSNFGARLDTLINNIDQLRNVVVGSAANLINRNS